MYSTWEGDYSDPLARVTLGYGKDEHEGRYVYRRRKWENTTTPSFRWNQYKNKYLYTNGGTVGKEVLEAKDLIMIRMPEGQQIKGVKMKKNVNYIGTDYSVVEVSYEIEYDGLVLTSYYFKTSIKNLEVGDLVVVESSEGLGLARVIATPIARSLDTVVIKQFNLAKAWVVNKVDMTIHNQRREATERKKFIMEQLAERKEAMEEVAIYKMLAQSDPDAAKLLEELDGLK